MRFQELPISARRYILYHALISPVLITWYLLPYYLLLTGYSVLEVGALFTAVNVLSVPLTLWLGKKFQSIDIRKGLATIDVLESMSTVAYGFAYGPIAPLMIVIGGLIEKASSTLYFLYPAYERIIYPEDKMKEALSIHLRIPELTIILTYPVIGFMLGCIWSSPASIRYSFFMFAAYQLALVPYILWFFKPVKISREEKDNPNASKSSLSHLPRKYLAYIIADVLFILAWLLAPNLALVYYVLKWVHGNIFHIALIEASISTATIIGTLIVDRLARDRPGRYLAAGTLITVAGLGMAVATNIFPITLLAFFIVRLGDSIVFVYKRLWLYSIMSRGEASIASAMISSVRRIISLFSPVLASLLASLTPRAPYIACMTLLLMTIPLYLSFLKKNQ